MGQQKRKQKQVPNQKAAIAQPVATGGRLTFWLGTLMLAIAIGASIILALDHFDVTRAPGCGPESGCDKATRGPWGTVPIINWPVSLLGVAYFSALLTGWIVAKGRPSRGFRFVTLLGDVGSIMFIGVMIIGGYLCKYCLVIHLANFGFLVVAILASRGKSTSPPHRSEIIPVEFAPASVAFALVTFALTALNFQTSAARQARDEEDLGKSVQQIIEAPSTPNESTEGVHAPPGGFTGRWLWGPENAPIRIVMFSDYQCRDCAAMETQVRQIMATRTDVSIASKHFPMCSDCNSHVSRTLHPNACWAARVSETAGLLYGSDGFWKMHHWLFEKGGHFTTREDLTAGIVHCGFDPARFLPALESNTKALADIQADADEAKALGLFFTPMIFINGVELRGFINDSNALIRAVDRIAQTNPPPGSPLQDRPPLALGKAVGDWRESTARALPPKQGERSLGSADAPIKIWVWGDYQSAHTQELNDYIRSVMSNRTDIHYVFRHYPMDQSCNPNMKQTMSNRGCWATRAAEAAGAIGGPDAFWKMHEWLLANRTNLTDEALRAAASEMGIDAEALFAAMNSPEVQSAISQDVASGRAMIPQGVPTIYVNGKWVGRWKLGDANVLELILQEAAQ